MPVIGDKFYEIVAGSMAGSWSVVWIRNGRDRPQVSRYSTPSARESVPATFNKREHAKAYIAELQENKGERVKCHD
jgi:hypothetical protein